MEPRQTTSNLGFEHSPCRAAIARGLDKLYYEVVISLRMNESEQRMLTCLNLTTWDRGLKQVAHTTQHEKNVESMKKMAKLSKEYHSWIKDEIGKTTKEF